MRSEYLEKCSLFYGLAEAVNRGVLLLPRMSHLQCERAILEPIENAEASISVPLVQRLLDETEDRQDGLPLLQHALRRIWDHWAARGSPSSKSPSRTSISREAIPPFRSSIATSTITSTPSTANCPRPPRHRPLHLHPALGVGRNRQRNPPPHHRQEIMDVSGADLAAVRATIAAFWNEDLARTFLTAPNLEEGSPGPDGRSRGRPLPRVPHAAVASAAAMDGPGARQRRAVPPPFRGAGKGKGRGPPLRTSPRHPHPVAELVGLPPFGPSVTRPSAIRSPAPADGD